MSEHIFQFFLDRRPPEYYWQQQKPKDGCCDVGLVNQIISWDYKPFDSTDSIEVVENTVYKNNSNNYAYVKGENFLDENNSIKGRLTLSYRCMDKCKIINQKAESRLRAVQVEGFACAIDGPSDHAFVPVGETIKIQLLGGFGPVRFATSSVPSRAFVSPRVSSEAQNYRPEMQVLGENQIDSGSFEVDRDLGDGNHIFSVTIKNIGPVSIIFKDEAGCNIYVNLYGAGNLCEHAVESQIDSWETYSNYIERDVDTEWMDINKGINRQISLTNGEFKESPPCNCDFHWGSTFRKTYFLPQILTGGLGSMKVYDNEIFAHGTRSLNLPDTEGEKLYINHVVEKYVGQKAEIKTPEWGGRWESSVVISETKGSWGGVGYDSENMIPWSLNEKSDERNLILTQGDSLDFRQPTNSAPVLIHVYSRDGNAIGPPNPQEAKYIISKKDNQGELVYTRRDGSFSSLHLETPKPANTIFMTNDDWYIAARSFCPSSQSLGPAPQGESVVHDEDDFFELSFHDIQGDDGFLDLPNNKSWYFTPTDVGRPNDIIIRDNVIRSPDLDDLPPQRTHNGSFQVGPGDQDINQEKVAITIYARPWVFWSNSEIPSWPPHLEFIKAHEVQYFKNGDFYDSITEETLGKHLHSPDINPPYAEYQTEGLTAQVRGSWCFQQNTINVDLISKLPVFAKDGKAKMVFDEEKNEVIVPEVIKNGKRKYKFSSKPFPAQPGKG
jgi:hypothetical protein